MNQNVKVQYKTAENLNIRSSIHLKYSTNKQTFGDWISEHYKIDSGARILELGCGTGSIWKDKLSLLEPNCSLVLSDFSPGMLETAKETVGMNPRVDYQVIDIQNIPYQDESFDIVIANMMLYHVPDLHKGLSEVRRVLKPGGSFYCATYGEHGIMQFINDTLHDLGIHGEVYKTFTLQNGEELLRNHFEEVAMCTREDGLKIPNVNDFVDYVMSMSSLAGTDNLKRDALNQAFESKLVDGVLYIPKEYGMFICK